MGIDKSNYEAYFLDLIEGNLSASAKEELDLFLAENPDLAAELSEFESIELDQESTEGFALKSKLRRHEETELSEWDYLLISELEGTLTLEEQKQLSALKENSILLNQDAAYYEQTKLAPESISFQAKQKLLRQPRIVYFMRYAAAAAAVLVALFYLINPNAEETYSPRYAKGEVLEQTLEEKPIKMEGVVVLDTNKVSPTPAQEPINRKRNFDQQFADEPKKTAPAGIPNVPESESQSIAEPSDLPAANDFAEEQESSSEASDPMNAQQTESLPSDDIMAEVNESTSKRPNKQEEDYLSVEELALKKIKEDVLKNKTLSETIADELASISKDKISFTQEKNESGKTELIAFNIGKFKFSRKR